MPVIARPVSKLSGYAPAVPTPFGDDGNIDIAALERLCDRQIREGATALVVCGTTGEAPTLSGAEHGAIVRVAVGVSHGRVPVIAGAGSNSTAMPSSLPRMPRRRARTPCSRWCRTTTSPVSRDLRPFPRDRAGDRTCRSSSTTCRRERHAASPTKRSFAWRRCRNASASRTRPLMSRARCGSGRWSGRISVAFGRRCDGARVLRAGRERRHFRHLQRGAGSLPQDVSRLRTGADGRSATAGEAGRAIDRRAVSRGQSGSGQIRLEPPQIHVAQGALAAGGIKRSIAERSRRDRCANVR